MSRPTTTAASALHHPPFRIIPGVNVDLSVSQQVEQIDQLITLLLQEIDANFAKFHQVITSRILPQIKRYALAAEPVRDSAKFWRSFYETAADVHVQIASEHSLATHEPSEMDQSHEESFIFHGAASSTPMSGRTNHASRSTSQYDDSMSDSLASPFDTLDRRLQDDLRIIDESDMATASLPSGYDMSGLQADSSIASTPRAPKTISQGTPRVVDLRSTPLNARFKPKLSLADLDGDDDDVALTMSPPVTMHFQLPPRASEVLATGRTPQKPQQRDDTAQRIVDDIMDEMSEDYIPSPRLPTPEGLRRYSLAPAQPAPRNLFAPPSVISEESASRTFARRSIANSSFGSDMQDVPDEHVFSNDETMDESYDSTASTIAPTDAIFGNPAPQAPAPTQFNLHRQDEMLTFFGGRLEDAAGRDVSDTPTNARIR